MTEVSQHFNIRIYPKVVSLAVVCLAVSACSGPYLINEDDSAALVESAVTASPTPSPSPSLSPSPTPSQIPPVTSWSINPTAELTRTVTTPTLSGSHVNTGATINVYTLSTCAGTATAAITLSTPGSFSTGAIALGEGPTSFYYTVADPTGVTLGCTASNISFTVDTTAPTGISIVGSNAPYSSSVTLALAATELYSQPIEMCVGESGSCSSCTWTSYQAAVSTSVSDGVHIKTLSAKFRDSIGNTSSCISNTVLAGLLSVTAAYTGNTNWNTYVKASDTSLPCLGTEVGINSCLHAGEARYVNTPYTTCTGLNMEDNLTNFNWLCAVDSTGYARFKSYLAPSKGLSTILSSSTVAFQPQSVTLVASGTAVATSAAATWWTNTITSLTVNTTTPVTLTTANSIYYLLSTTLSGGILSVTDNVAIVVHPSVTLSWNDAAVAGNCGIDGECLVYALARNFQWIEGTYVNSALGDIGVYLNAGKFHQYRNIRTSGFPKGLQVGGANSNLENIVAGNSLDRAISTTGEYIVGSQMRVFNSVNGINIGGSSNQNYSRVTAASNTTGFQVNSASVTLSSVTALNNVIGANINASLVTIHNAYFVNNGTGFRGLSGTGSTVSQVVSTNNTLNYSIEGTIDLVRFTGIFGRGTAGTTDCQNTSSGTNTGLSGACAATDRSSFTDVSGLDSTNTIKGKVVVDEPTNTSDSMGSAIANVISDWTGFLDNFRFWGVDGSAFPNSDQTGRCTGGVTTCRIWNTVVNTADVTIKDRSAAVTTLNSDPGGNACPNAEIANGITLNSAAGSTQYLRLATEILLDGYGDDDGLCEGSEVCSYNPNFGAYQGHGALTKCDYTTGVSPLTSITILERATNGQ